MNLKDLKFKEYLVIVFITLGLIAFALEEKFKPTILEASGSDEGFNGDITVNIKAYKKSNGDIRITEIDVEHNDTEAIAGPAVAKLTETVLNTQKFDLDIIAGATYTSEGFIIALDEALSKLN